jgi:Rad3-related DNA helicase
MSNVIDLDEYRSKQQDDALTTFEYDLSQQDSTEESKPKVVSNDPDYENLRDYFPFPSFREGQEFVIKKIQKYLCDPNIKCILVEAGTGWGKSGYALAAAGAAKAAYVATANKFLQDQYTRDFSDIMVDMKGRANYTCNCYTVPEDLKKHIGPHYNCENSPCRATKKSRDTCAKERGCEYHKQLFKAATAKITCFNFASALVFLNYMKGLFKKRNLLVCDECHNIPNWITNFVSIEISAKILKDLELSTKIPDLPDVEDYASFIKNVQDEVNYLLNQDDNLVDTKLISKLEKFQKKLDLFDDLTNKKEDMDNFVVEKIYEDTKKISKLIFQPVVVADIVNEYLFRYADKVLLLSATILDFKTYTDMLGIDPKETAIIKVPSIFPVENRPIYTHMAVGYLNKNNLDSLLPDIVESIKIILAHYPDYKGIIHGVTYKICNYIYEHLNDSRILYPRKASEQKEYYEQHLKTSEPTILLSPSMTEGVDLKFDASRLQILVKTPYAYLGNPVLAARMKIYENYYNMLTALTITQAYGRSIRDMEDFCFTFFLDRCSQSFISTNRDILQDSFLEAIK